MIIIYPYDAKYPKILFPWKPSSVERKRKRSLKGNRERLLRISVPSLVSVRSTCGGVKTSERFDVIIDKEQTEARELRWMFVRIGKGEHDN